MPIVDLSITIDSETTFPTGAKVKTESMTFRPGYLRGSLWTFYSHCASHVDAPLHAIDNGKTMDEIPLEKVIGEAVVLDLTYKGANEPIVVEDLEGHAGEIREGDMVVLRTDWAQKTWGTEDYWKNSPYISDEAARWLVGKKPKAVAFDCFQEYNARFATRKDFNEEKYPFTTHKILLGGGVIIIEGLVNLGSLRKKRVKLFAAPVKFRGDAGVARIFAIDD